MKYNKSKQIIEDELDTSFILAMRYRAPCVELSVVCRHYFPNLKNISEINRKASQQGFPFPVFRADPNNKRSSYFVKISALAAWIDEQAEQGEREWEQVNH